MPYGFFKGYKTLYPYPYPYPYPSTICVPFTQWLCLTHDNNLNINLTILGLVLKAIYANCYDFYSFTHSFSLNYTLNLLSSEFGRRRRVRSHARCWLQLVGCAALLLDASNFRGPDGVGESGVEPRRSLRRRERVKEK